MTIQTRPATQAYRDGWEATFGAGDCDRKVTGVSSELVFAEGVTLPPEFFEIITGRPSPDNPLPRLTEAVPGMWNYRDARFTAVQAAGRVPGYPNWTTASIAEAREHYTMTLLQFDQDDSAKKRAEFLQLLIDVADVTEQSDEEAVIWECYELAKKKWGIE